MKICIEFNPETKTVVGTSVEDSNRWFFPVGDDDYPPEKWYAATVHDPTGALNNGYRHTGLDLNLDVPPWGDVERRLGLSVYAIHDAEVVYVTDSWSGVPMLVIKTQWRGKPLWVRYGHVVPVVKTGQSVKGGEKLGGFANWRTGDHLHFDMALDPFTREWLDPTIHWINPVEVLKDTLDPHIVDEMIRRT